jgi:hypothetical protein
MVCWDARRAPVEVDPPRDRRPIFGRNGYAVNDAARHGAMIPMVIVTSIAASLRVE